MEAKVTLGVIKTNSPKETLEFGKNLAASLKLGDVVALYGELGSGKTVFTKGLAKGLNVKKRIVSPTFVLQRSYRAKINGHDANLHHLDLYRAQNVRDLDSLGLDEIFSMDSVVILEWAGKIKGKLGKRRIDVIIEKLNETDRQITIKRS